MSIDINSPLWTAQDAGNIAPIPDGLPTGTEASKLYPLIWAMRGAEKRLYNNDHATVTATLLPTNPLVYVLNYEEEPLVNEGKSFTFNVDTANAAGAIRIMINGTYYDIKSFVVNSDGNLASGEILTTVPVTIVYKGTRFILENSQKINDTSLPSTMTGKTFSSETTISDGGLKITAGGLVISAGGAGIGGDLAVTGKTNLVGDTTVVGTLSQGGNAVLTTANQPFLLARANHTGTQPVSTVAGLQATIDSLNASVAALESGRVSKAGDTMTGNLQVGSIILKTDGSLSAGNALTTNMTVKNGELSFQRHSQSTGYQWSIAGSRENDTTLRWYYNNGNQRMALTDAGRLWTGVHGYLDDAFAAKGAQCPHNSGVWEFGSVDPNYNDRLADAPFPYVLVGLRSSRGTNVINLRAVTLRNQ